MNFPNFVDPTVVTERASLFSKKKPNLENEIIINMVYVHIYTHIYMYVVDGDCSHEIKRCLLLG